MASTYDKSAGHYDRALAPLERLFLGKARAETLGLLPKDAVILEIGAGTGANFKFYPPCRQAIASELSINMIEIAKGKSELIRLVQADAESLPFPASHFDAAFATLVFCSIPHPEKAFAELIRTLKPGGRIVLLEHVRPKGWLGYFFDVANLFFAALLDDRINRRTSETAERAGLKIVEVREKLWGIFNLIVCETHAEQGRMG